MADGTKIEWTDATWNPITGCSVVSPGCTNCYAMRLAGTRLRHHPSRAELTVDTKAGPVWNGQVRLNEQWLDQPLSWTRPRDIFVCAHSDLFHPRAARYLDRVFAIMARAPWHRFQVLTKRSDLMREYAQTAHACGEHWLAHIDGAPPVTWPLPNVWLGVSAEDQPRFDQRWSDLEQTPAAVRWISGEPLLGPIHMRGAKPDWVVAGGESGIGSRPMHPDWARSLRDQCSANGIAFHFKQWGGWISYLDRDQDDPDWRASYSRFERSTSFAFLNYAGGCGFHGERLHVMQRVGKKAAGRLLDGVQHDGMPA